eukprot:TRINITY_DN8514_c0_g1_i1.p2 TRINITY_DN8514_c0_g1~~TRINITY_DN8514_c0_g1_i1.p2  ORF type:complete len:681 (-),score=119.80 TRINITY_DN8514_c0_g1_i1:2183-4225(-)
MEERKAAYAEFFRQANAYSIAAADRAFSLGAFDATVLAGPPPGLVGVRTEASDAEVSEDTPPDALYRKSLQWKLERDECARRRQQFQTERELAQCTFHPAITRRSENLSRRECETPVTERLYEKGQKKRQEREETASRFREWRISTECTFQPAINDADVSPRFLREYAPVPPARDPECTFTPSINQSSVLMVSQLSSKSGATPRKTHRGRRHSSHSAAAQQAAPQRAFSITAELARTQEKHRSAPRESASATAAALYRNMAEKAADEVRQLDRLIEQAAATLEERGTRTKDTEHSGILLATPSRNSAPDSDAETTKLFDATPSRPFGPTTEHNDNSLVFVDRTDGQLYTSAKGVFTDSSGNLYTDVNTLRRALNNFVRSDRAGNVFTEASVSTSPRVDIPRMQINGAYVESNYQDSDGEECTNEASCTDGVVNLCPGVSAVIDVSERVDVMLPSGECLDWNAFLERQNFCETSRLERMSRIENGCAQSHKPKINRKSIDILRKAQQPLGSPEKFKSRQEVLRGKATARKEALQKEAIAECTFHPRIAEFAKKQPKKSFAELSSTDTIRREKALRELREQKARKELDGASFHPQISDKAKEAQSMLYLREDIAGYVGKMRQKQEQAETERLALQSSLQQKEMQDCTFRPTINNSPAYVKRIAQSMTLVRAQRAASDAAGRE